MLYQDDFIGQLSEVSSLRGFLAISVYQISQSIEQLIYKVFHKDDFALKSVVDSLFTNQGPLTDLSVRLKLLLGLGVIELPLFEDINSFLQLKREISDSASDYGFSDELIVVFLKKLNYRYLVDIELDLVKIDKSNSDSLLLQLQKNRFEKSIRSYLIIIMTKIIERLDIESPL